MKQSRGGTILRLLYDIFNNTVFPELRALINTLRTYLIFFFSKELEGIGLNHYQTSFDVVPDNVWKVVARLSCRFGTL